LAFAVAYAAGCVVGQWPVLAVAALAGLAYTGVIASVRRPVVRVAPAVLVPAFALGMNEPVPDGFRLAAVFLAGGAWATVVAWCWREASAPTRAPAPIGRPSDAKRAPRSYAICFAAAASLGLAIGYLLDVAHVAWAAAAAIFIMRPDPGLAASRAVGRVLATFAGVLLGALVYHRGPAEAALAMIVVATVAAMVAVRSSRWYVTAAGSGLLVLLLSGVSSRQEFSMAFHDRVLETAIGAGLALVFGVGIPRLTARRPQSVQGRSA
jgi:hypothetical protein